MLTENLTYKKVIWILFKDFSTEHTITSLAKFAKISRVGAWKILKKLEHEGLIELNPLGDGKTSAYMVHLRWENPILAKILVLFLAQEASKYKRWAFDFSDLEDKVEFMVLFGSVLFSFKDANDIDILCLVKEKNIGKLGDIILNIQKTQDKKIHSINFIKRELKQELKEKNKTFIDVFKKGIVLFGQENFVNFMKEVHGYES